MRLKFIELVFSDITPLFTFYHSNIKTLVNLGTKVTDIEFTFYHSDIKTGTNNIMLNLTH